MANVNRLKVALVHDYLKDFGGAERVLLALHEIWPEAPIYTIFKKGPTFAQPNRRASAGKDLRDWGDLGKAKIVESWFGKMPFCDKLISPLRFLIPLIWGSFVRQLADSKYDLVISSASWAVTKGFGGRVFTRSLLAEGKERPLERAERKDRPVEICYCHTPPRYLYGYETSRNWKRHWWIRAYALVVNHFMRMYDFNQAQKVDFFIANSREVAARIKKFYRREAVVINPPVEIPLIANSKQLMANSNRQLAISYKQYFLTGGRLESAKNFDLVIKACNELKVALKVYGGGTQEEYLRSIAGPTIEFLGRVSDEEKFRLMAEAKAFIVMAKDEDFGITPVEAMAVGTPVIAYRGGGYLETVVEGRTGVFVEEAKVESLVRVIRDFRDVGKTIKSEDCRKQAEKFSKERFKKEIINFVEKNVEKILDKPE